MADFNTDQGAVDGASYKAAMAGSTPKSVAADEPPMIASLAEKAPGPSIGNNDKYKMR